MNTEVILGIIPARYGSTRFPGKPLSLIGNKTMIQRVYEQATTVLPNCYVATDDERILQEVTKFGGKVVMTSDQHQSGTDRCAEALNTVEKLENKKFKAIINIQGDEPFIAPEQIATLANCFSNETTEIATLIKKVTTKEDLFNPNKPKVVLNKNKEALYFSRSPIPYFRGEPEENWHEKFTFYNHIGLYGYRADILLKITQLPQSPLELTESLEQLRWLENGLSIITKETSIETVSIDTPEDLESVLKSGLL